MSYKKLPKMILFREIVKNAVLNQEVIIDVSGEVRNGMSTNNNLIMIDEGMLFKRGMSKSEFIVKKYPYIKKWLESIK